MFVSAGGSYSIISFLNCTVSSNTATVGDGRLHVVCVKCLWPLTTHVYVVEQEEECMRWLVITLEIACYRS